MFPHRSSAKLNEAPPSAADLGGGKAAKHLRSPLLEGGDFENEEDSIEINKGKRLRSHVLGGTGQKIEDDFAARVPDSDPNALRSPLLVARVPQPEKPTAAPPTTRQTSQPVDANAPASSNT